MGAIVLPEHIERPNPALYMSDNYLVLDFEIDTSHGDYGNPVHNTNQMLLACWKNPSPVLTRAGESDNRYRVQTKWGTEFEMAQLLEDLAQVDFLVAHNAKYELGWLRRCGADLHKLLVFDTKLAEYVLLGNRPLSTSLDMCCRRRGLPIKDPVVDTMIKNGINPVRIPRPWLEGRCKQDVVTTEQVFLDQRRTLVAAHMLPVLYTRCLLTPVLADMEPEGMALDSDKVQIAYTEHVDKLKVLGDETNALTGGINWKSGKQLGAYLYDTLKFQELKKPNGEPRRTSKQARLTDQKTRAKLVAHTPEQKHFVKLRKEVGKVSAALTKSLEFYQGVCSEAGGVFRAEFNQSVTATHRLSSSGLPQAFRLFDGDVKRVQFQNQPRAFKPLFKAKREGWSIGEADGSGLEFHVAVFLGQDKQGILDLEDPGHDVHKFTASVLFNTPYGSVTTDGSHSQRQLAKEHTFKPLYGGTKGSKAEERYYAAFRTRYKGIDQAQRDWLNEVIRTKQLVTPWGLRYYWPTARLARSGYCNVTSSVYNYPIQALATAEIIPIAVAYFWHRVRAFGLQDVIIPVNTVHDSIVVEIAPGYEQTFRDLAQQCFTLDVYEYLKSVYNIDFNVPLGVGIKIGTHWGTGKEEAFTVWPDGRVRRDK